MAKQRVLSGREVCRILESQGFELIRQKGSHAILQRRTDVTTITVPVPLHKELERGTLNAIIRQSKLPKEAFE